MGDTPRIVPLAPRFPALTDSTGARNYPRGLTKKELAALPQEWRDLTWKRGEKTYRLPPSETNALGILRHDLRWRRILAYDEMAQKMVFQAPPPWLPYEPSAKAGTFDPDRDHVRLADWFARSYSMPMSPKRLLDCAVVVAQDIIFHPVRDWLLFVERKAAWDKVERVETFFSRYLGAADTPYTRAVGRCLLVSLVARPMVPGCKADHVVVIEGIQGEGKSTALKVLASEEWFGEATANIASKDAQLAMHGKWILEMPELAALSRAQVEIIKAFFSRGSDWLRPPYFRGFVDLKRSSVAVATTNAPQYLDDKTGNRRYLPVECGVKGGIDLAGIRKDRVQIFKEAVDLYRRGTRWWLTNEETRLLAAPETAERETIDPWEDIIAAWVRVVVGDGKRRGDVGFTLAACLEHALHIDAKSQSISEGRRVSGILNHLGLRASRPRKGAEGRPRVYRWPVGGTAGTDKNTPPNTF